MDFFFLKVVSALACISERLKNGGGGRHSCKCLTQSVPGYCSNAVAGQGMKQVQGRDNDHVELGLTAVRGSGFNRESLVTMEIFMG